MAACGDVNRNVMCNPNPYQSRAHAAALELARAISDHLTPAHPRLSRDLAGRREGGRQRGGRGADLRPALPAAQVQDRRRRAAVQRRRRVRPGPGFIAITGEDGKLVGYNVAVGGGMGMTHGEPETYPRIADVIGFCPPEQVVDVAEKVVARAARLRRPQPIASTRGSSTRSTTTASTGSAPRSSGGCGFALEAPRPFRVRAHRRPLRLGRRTTRATGTHAVRRRTAACWTRPDRPMRTGLAEIARVHQGDFRLTPNQNLIIARVRPRQGAGSRSCSRSTARQRPQRAAPELAGLRRAADLRPRAGRERALPAGPRDARSRRCSSARPARRRHRDPHDRLPERLRPAVSRRDRPGRAYARQVQPVSRRRLRRPRLNKLYRRTSATTRSSPR